MRFLRKLNRDWKNVLALGGRQILVQLMGIINGVYLARHFSPAEFGMYTVFSFQFIFHLGIGDFGLGASVIRQRDQPSLETLRSVHSVRQFLDLCQLSLVWCIAPWIADHYHVAQACWGFRLVALAVFLQSFQVIPTVLMERKLCFSRLAIVEISQAVVFSLLCISLTHFEWGILGVAIAWLGYSISGALLALLMHSWSLGWRFDRQEIAHRLRFGFPYQGTNLINVLKDGVTPLGLGLLVGAGAVGYFNWAQMLALSCANGLLVLQRYYLPLMAKAQDDVVELRALFGSSLRLSHALLAPVALIILLFAEPITARVFGEKWLSALPLFYLIWIGNFFIPFSAPIYSLLYASARSDLALYFTIGSSLASWIFGLTFLAIFGLPGLAISFSLSSALNLLPLFALKQHLTAEIFLSILRIWLVSALVCSGFLLIVKLLS